MSMMDKMYEREEKLARIDKYDEKTESHKETVAFFIGVLLLGICITALVNFISVL